MEVLGQITFRWPVSFCLLLLLPALAYYYFVYLRHRMPRLMINYPPVENTRKRPVPVDYLMLLRLISIALLIFGLADPQITANRVIRSSTPETAIVLTLDVSKSMLLEDIKPNRIEALKDVLNRFVTMRSRDKMGMVLYAGDSMNWCPLTKNYALLFNRISHMEDNDLGDGTAIGSGLASAINILKQCSLKNKVIILLTDGENNAGNIEPEVAADFARRFNIKIYAVGIGRTGFAQMPLEGIDGKKYYQKIFVRLNDTVLTKITKLTGGLYYKATDATALRNIYGAISKRETARIKWETVKVSGSIFDWFAIAALFLLLVEVCLRNTFLRTWPV